MPQGRATWAWIATTIPAMWPCSRCASPLFSQGTGSINPPGAARNTWIGHRAQLDAMGYGFLLLFNGREYAELKASGDAAGVGKRDAAAAVSTAKSEGFPAEVGHFSGPGAGRTDAARAACLHSCLGGRSDRKWLSGRDLLLWNPISTSRARFRWSRPTTFATTRVDGTLSSLFPTINADRRRDACFRRRRPRPAKSGVDFAEVWQYAQSPRRPELTASCRKTYAADGNCYPPGVAPSSGLHIDVNSANSPDPSHGRSH